MTTTCTDATLAELEAEAATTRRVLAAIPADRLAWQPHEKSMTMARLAGHVAGIPGRISQMLGEDGFDFGELPRFDAPESVEALLARHDEGLAAAREAIMGWSEAELAAEWRAHDAGRTLAAMPRAVALRTLLFNHWVHHRGQLSVYLRLVDAPVPSIYGPSADDNPFA